MSLLHSETDAALIQAELQDLRSLADQISGRLDNEQGEALRHRLQDQEQALLDQLELVASQDQLDGIERWIEAGRARLAEPG